MFSAVEGTFQIEGILEGKITSNPDQWVKKLQDWIQFAASFQLSFSLEIEGNNFNILANKKTYTRSNFSSNPEVLITDLLEQLAAGLPKDPNLVLFSTIRSIEYIPQWKIQTMYLFRPDKTIETKCCKEEAETNPAILPQKKDKLIVSLMIGIALLIAFAVSVFFVDYPRIIHSTYRKMVGITPDAIILENKIFDRYFSLQTSRENTWSNSLILTLTKQSAYSENLLELESQYKNHTIEAEALLIFLALKSGYLHCEAVDVHGQIVSTAMIPAKNWNAKNQIKFALPLAPEAEIQKLTLTY